MYVRPRGCGRAAYHRTIEPVTVLIPCYNGAAYLRRTLKSVGDQDTDVRVVIVDDGSNDESWSLVREWVSRHSNAIALRNDENLGVCRTLNRGLEHVTTEFVVIFGHDDVMLPNCASELRATIERLGESCVSVSAVGIVGDRNADPVLTKAGDVELAPSLQDAHLMEPGSLIARLLTHNQFNSCCIHRSAVVSRLGYDPEMLYEDWDLWCRLSIDYRIGSTTDPLYIFRRPEWSLSTTAQSSGKEEVGRNVMRRKFLGRSDDLDLHIVRLATTDAWRMIAKIRPADARQTLRGLPRTVWKVDLARWSAYSVALLPAWSLLQIARVRHCWRLVFGNIVR